VACIYVNPSARARVTFISLVAKNHVHLMFMLFNGSLLFYQNFRRLRRFEVFSMLLPHVFLKLKLRENCLWYKLVVLIIETHKNLNLVRNKLLAAIKNLNY
jgi:hypothetical protein